MDITLSIEQQEEAKELLKKLTELYRARVELESIKAGRIEKLQYEVAGELDLKNKNGDVEPKLVKKPILLSALESKTGDRQKTGAPGFLGQLVPELQGRGAQSERAVQAVCQPGHGLHRHKYWRQRYL